MEGRDFRSIGRAAQEGLRRRALVLVEQGASQGEAARAVGVQRQTVNLWLKRYRTQGEAGADQPEPDLGGLQPWSDALHAL